MSEEAVNWLLEKLSFPAKKQPKKETAPKKTQSPKPKKVEAPKPPPISTPAPKKGTKKPLSPEELQGRKKTERELWEKWKNSGYHHEHLQPLLASIDNMIQGRAGMFKGKVEIPDAAIDFEFKKQAVSALKDWDPKKSALSTHLQLRLKKGNRFIIGNQNALRIPENLAKHIGKFNAARSDLAERLGHDPDANMLAEETGLSLKDVKRLLKEQRKSFIDTGDSSLEFAPAGATSSRLNEVLALIHHELTPEERIFHEYYNGLNGRPKITSTSQIAKEISKGGKRWDDSKVSKVKRSYIEKLKKYL